jgi:rubrerythrin
VFRTFLVRELMARFVCPTCGATLYSAAPLTKCPWCGTDVPGSPKEFDDARSTEDEDG